jgi:branched-chain amino acid transport system ATP-binding protein
VSGDLRADAGAVHFGGRDITALPPHRRCRAGLGRSYQIPQPFGAMTVFENLLVAASFGGGLREREAYPLCVEVLAATRLEARANSLASTLTLLDRKRLELARALATRPRLLLLDEIAAGLTEPEAQELVGELKALRARGITMIWIEHVMHALLAVADRLFVMNYGQKLAEGSPQEVLGNSEVQRVYMGIEA